MSRLSSVDACMILLYYFARTLPVALYVLNLTFNFSLLIGLTMRNDI